MTLKIDSFDTLKAIFIFECQICHIIPHIIEYINMFNWNSSYLKREKDNPYNAKAIAIYFEDYKLGFVPRNENDELSKFCDQGYSKVFEVRINRFPPEEHPENQISIVVHLMHFKDL